METAKESLVRYLQVGRDALVWKVEGLSEYDARRPLTPTGTSLLGLVQHVAGVELGYFGEVFGRPTGIELPWDTEDADMNEDLYVAGDVSRSWVLDLYHAAWAHAATTFAELDLDAEGLVPWWGDRGRVTLHQILVHVATETHRHAGHADILRELLDGRLGRMPDDGNIEQGYDWPAHVARVEAAAVAAQERAGRH